MQVDRVCGYILTHFNISMIKQASFPMLNSFYETNSDLLYSISLIEILLLFWPFSCCIVSHLLWFELIYVSLST